MLLQNRTTFVSTDALTSRSYFVKGRATVAPRHGFETRFTAKSQVAKTRNLSRSFYEAGYPGPFS